MSEYSIPTPKLQYHGNSDDRLRIYTLFYQARFTKDQIALQLNLTIRQIEYALQHQLTLQKRCSGRPFLGPSERQKLVVWVCASAENRRVPWGQIPAIFGWDCNVYAIETVFKLERFKHCTALRSQISYLNMLLCWYPQVISSHYGLKEAVLGGWDNITKSKFEN
ncbi:transposable element tc1 protein [Rutstroemia sp. NJR-2017a WRK4]|nr:transposable element tc1 protein [Rutstroemia sp. NJR-2017a WRK4]